MMRFRPMVALAASAALAVAGCDAAGGKDGISAQSATNMASAASSVADEVMRKPAQINEQFVEMAYINSRTFDKELSDNMGSKVAEITVMATSPFTLNNVPERLDKWFYAVKQSGGRVQAQALPPKDQVATRGFAAVIIDLVVALVSAQIERNMYDTAKHYDAKVLYSKETGQVEKILFTLRPVPEKTSATPTAIEKVE